MDESFLLRTRVPAKRFRVAEEILKRLGLTPGDAVNMLLAQIELRRGLPFEIALQDDRILSPSQQAREWDHALGEY
jgi:addiction module RelB/DinJ family antitoxin